jgi:MFS family permease
MRDCLGEQEGLKARVSDRLAIAPAVLAVLKPSTNRQVSTIRNDRALYAGLGFAVTTQMTVYLLFAAVPVIASEIAGNYLFNVRLLSFYYPLAYTVAFFSNFAIPRLLPQLGGAGLSVVCIVAAAVGLIIVPPAAPLLIIAAPLALGFSIGGVTPATSQVVGPFASPHTAGLIMSVRQSAISAGAMLAGVIMPMLAFYWGRNALRVIGLAGAGLAILLLPALRWLNDRGSTGTRAQRPSGPVKRLLAMPGMPQILFAILTYLMMVSCLRSFLTVYLVDDLGFDLATAGLIFSATQLAGIAGQIGCAVASDRWISARAVLAINGALMTTAAGLAANFTRDWPIAGIAAVTVFLGFFSVGAVPVMLGEITRRSPPEQVGALVSGGNFFIMAGCTIGPLFYGAFGSLMGNAGGLGAVAVCTLLGAVAAVPLPFRRTCGRVEPAEACCRDRVGTIVAATPSHDLRTRISQ